MASVLPTIEAHLLEVFRDALTDEGVRVVYGYADAPQLVAVFTAEWDREFSSLGPQPTPMNESFTIDVVIEVIQPTGRDMKPAADRVWEIFDLLDEAIREDAHLEKAAFDARFGKGRREFFQTDKQQGARIQTSIAGTARV